MNHIGINLVSAIVYDNWSVKDSCIRTYNIVQRLELTEIVLQKLSPMKLREIPNMFMVQLWFLRASKIYFMGRTLLMLRNTPLIQVLFNTC